MVYYTFYSCFLHYSTEKLKCKVDLRMFTKSEKYLMNLEVFLNICLFVIEKVHISWRQR